MGGAEKNSENIRYKDILKDFITLQFAQHLTERKTHQLIIVRFQFVELTSNNKIY